MFLTRSLHELLQLEGESSNTEEYQSFSHHHSSAGKNWFLLCQSFPDHFNTAHRKGFHDALLVERFTMRECLYFTKECLYCTKECLYCTKECQYFTKECVHSTKECLYSAKECLYCTKECVYSTKECLYSTRTRELLTNPSLLPLRFPSTLKISGFGKSLGCRWYISLNLVEQR